MEEHKYEIKNEHYQFFVSQCEHWLEVFGLLHWRVYFAFGGFEGEEVKAECWVNIEGKCATIKLAKEWRSCSPTRRELSTTAFHECIELLLWPLGDIASKRFGVTSEDIERETHSIVRTLENVVFVRFYQERE